MKKLFALVSALTLCSAAIAAPEAAAPAPKTAQQSKMVTCNADAKEMKGDERKAFMSKCLSAKGKDDKELTAQQQKMKSCNAQASKKEMKGDERKAFMSKCLSA
jgi:hypothetical protein